MSRLPLPDTLGSLLTKDDLNWWDEWDYHVTGSLTLDDQPFIEVQLVNENGDVRLVVFEVKRMGHKTKVAGSNEWVNVELAGQ